MARQSIILLPNTGVEINVTGQAIKAAGYYGSGMNIHTVAVYLQDFRGRLFIDGTLASNPVEDDWFPVTIGGYQDFVDYPNTYTPNPPALPTGITAIDSFSFDGNFVFLRARVDRTYLPNYQTTNYGAIQKILINY